MGLDHPGFQNHSQLSEVKCQYIIRSDKCSKEAKEASKYQELQCFLASCSPQI